MTVINLDLFKAVFESARDTLDNIKGDPKSVLSEADLQSRLFMALSNKIENSPDRGGQIGLHSELRFFASPENKKRGIYPDLCILEKDNYQLCDSQISTKGYVIRGSCIHVELKMRRNNRGNASPKRWIRDLEKLANFRDHWSSIDQAEGNAFFPMFVAYSRLPIKPDELNSLKEVSDNHKIWALACDDCNGSNVWSNKPSLDP